MVWGLIANAVTIAILSGLYFLAKTAGWQLCLAFSAGFAACYVLFKCWRFDRDDAPVIKE